MIMNISQSCHRDFLSVGCEMGNAYNTHKLKKKPKGKNKLSQVVKTFRTKYCEKKKIKNVNGSLAEVAYIIMNK